MSATRLRVNVIVTVLLGLVCTGLVTPSILLVCRSSYRINCGNHLKQLALAEANYESTNGHRAPGTHPNVNLQPEQRFSWCFEILPYTGKNSMYRTANFDKAWDDPVNVANREYWPYFVCPAGPDFKTSLNTSFLGLAGIGQDAAILPTSDRRSGIFGYDRKVRKEDIKDGYSNTISLLESRSGGPWAQGGPSTVGGLVVNQRPYVGEMRPFGSWHSEHFDYSFSTKKIAQAAMADGSVRELLSTTSPELLEALATINGGESVKE